LALSRARNWAGCSCPRGRAQPSGGRSAVAERFAAPMASAPAASPASAAAASGPAAAESFFAEGALVKDQQGNFAVATATWTARDASARLSALPVEKVEGCSRHGGAAAATARWRFKRQSPRVESASEGRLAGLGAHLVPRIAAKKDLSLKWANSCYVMVEREAAGPTTQAPDAVTVAAMIRGLREEGFALSPRGAASILPTRPRSPDVVAERVRGRSTGQRRPLPEMQRSVLHQEGAPAIGDSPGLAEDTLFRALTPRPRCGSRTKCSWNESATSSEFESALPVRAKANWPVDVSGARLVARGLADSLRSELRDVEAALTCAVLARVPQSRWLANVVVKIFQETDAARVEDDIHMPGQSGGCRVRCALACHGLFDIPLLPPVLAFSETMVDIMAIAVFVVHILRSKDPQAVPLGTVDDCTERRFAGTTRGIEAICHTLAHAGGVQVNYDRQAAYALKALFGRFNPTAADLFSVQAGRAGARAQAIRAAGCQVATPLEALQKFIQGDRLATNVDASAVLASFLGGTLRRAQDNALPPKAVVHVLLSRLGAPRLAEQLWQARLGAQGLQGEPVAFDAWFRIGMADRAQRQSLPLKRGGRWRVTMKREDGSTARAEKRSALADG
ncbi:unnamed protein product, partial [Prorocentrum cordatum]